MIESSCVKQADPLAPRSRLEMGRGGGSPIALIYDIPHSSLSSLQPQAFLPASACCFSSAREVERSTSRGTFLIKNFSYIFQATQPDLLCIFVYSRLDLPSHRSSADCSQFSSCLPHRPSPETATASRAPVDSFPALLRPIRPPQTEAIPPWIDQYNSSLLWHRKWREFNRENICSWHVFIEGNTIGS